jgi:hypothetical protein
MKKLALLFLASVIAGCGGGSGPSTTPTVTIASNPAPAVATPKPCINPHTDSSYPDSFKGKYNVPEVRDTLPINIERSVGLKDYRPQLSSWWEAYKVDNGCKGDEYVKVLYRDSLDRLQSLGVDYVELYIGSQGWTVDPNLNYWVIKPESLSHSYALIEYIAQEAKKRNIKINLIWQLNIVEFEMNGGKDPKFLVQLGQVVNSKLWATILESHHKNIIEIAKLAERVGIDRMAADWNAMNVGNFHDPVLQEMYVQKMLVIIDDMRKVYSGKITFGQIGFVWHDNRIIDKVDILNVSIIPRLTKTEMINLSPEIVKDRTLQEIYKAYQDFHCMPPSYNYCTLVRSGRQVPVIFQISIQSKDDYLTGGGAEDGFCVQGNTVDGKSHDCIQATYLTDFSAQAIAVDGVLRAIKQQTHFPVQGVNFHSSYWHTDTLKPSTGYVKTEWGTVEDGEGFPNLSQSIRGKPAETVVKQWFKRS